MRAVRLRPESPQQVPGYQIDMGANYWGSLWEEGGAGMLQQFRELRITAAVFGIRAEDKQLAR